MPKGETPLNSKVLPPFAALRAFEAVFRLGGIRKAAASLDLNHAVVSRHIRLLEEWLGAPILTRSGNRLMLTEAGERFHVRVSAALMDIALATRDLRDQDARNHLRLSCVPGFAIQWLSHQLADFEHDHPQFSVELKPTDNSANLLLHEADVDVRYYGDDWPPAPGGKGLRFVELARPEILAVANPKTARKLKGLGSVADLTTGPLLHEEHQEQWRAWLVRNGVDVPKKLPGQLFWHAHLALAAARQGRGVALASTYLVGKDIERGELVEVSIPGARRVPLGRYAFVAREDRWSLPALIALRRFLQARARRHQYGAP